MLGIEDTIIKPKKLGYIYKKKMSTYEAFEAIMDALISVVENDDTTLDCAMKVTLSKNQCVVTISQDIRLDNIDTEIFDVAISDSVTTIKYIA